MVGRNYIKEWRRHRGLTVDRLAEAVGVSHASMSRIESGRQQYNQGYLEKMGAALDCSPSDLISVNPGEMDPLMEAMRDLTPQQAAQIVAIAKAIKETGK